MATTGQRKTLGAALADIGLTGFGGISAAINGSVNTTLDITVTQPAWALLGDGTILDVELATTKITGLTTDGTYSLWLDYTQSGGSYSPSWSVVASAPSTNAIKVAAVTVSSSVLSAVTTQPTGLGSLHEPLTFAPTTPAFPATTVWTQNTTGRDVVAYCNTSALTQTHVYVNSTNSATGALDLTAEAPGTIVIPAGYYISFTYSAGTGAWVWQGLRTL